MTANFLISLSFSVKCHRTEDAENGGVFATASVQNSSHQAPFVFFRVLEDTCLLGEPRGVFDIIGSVINSWPVF